MKKFKKLMAGLLVFSMMLTMMVTPVFATEEADPADGTETTEAGCEHEYKCTICRVYVDALKQEISKQECSKCGTPQYVAAHTHTLNQVGVCTCCELNVLGLMNQAYIYAFPLVLMDVTAEKVTNTEKATYTQAPTNQFVHVPALANAEAKDIVLPNVDTLYSQAFLDLSKTPVIMELPKTDRFCIMQAMDAYSNTIDIIECNELEERTTYIFTGPNYEGSIPEGMVQIASPTNMVWLLGRTVCADNENNPQDGYAITVGIQYKMKMYTLEQYENGTKDIPLTGEYEEEYDGIVPLDYVVYNLSVDEFFDRANQLMVENPPAAADAAVMKLFSYIGVGPGLDFDSEKLCGTQGATALYGWIRQNIVENGVKGSIAFHKVNGVWSYYGTPIGDYGTEYAFRCLIALAGFGANPPEMAVYPSAEVDVTGEKLTGVNAYLIHLNKEQLEILEKHNGYGFWSITAYGTDQYLIANEENRYCINDRNVVYNEDGTIDIYVGKEAPKDAEKYPNWLPVGEEGFKLYFRMYLPCEEIVNNDWTMPGIVKYVEEDTTEEEPTTEETTDSEITTEDTTEAEVTTEDTTENETEKGDTSTDKEDTKAPATGDNNAIFLWVVICIMSLSAMIFMKKKSA